MTVHRLPGLRAAPLASYLSGLGLARVLAEQVDPDLACWWGADGLVLDTAVEDLPGWLAEHYVPTPVLSPWNEGSGFGTKDKTPKQTLAALLTHPDPRLDGYREAAAVAAEVGMEYRSGALTKEQAVRAFRNDCPGAAVSWVDATVVLTGGQAYFPPLLGTGGNDGRLDFSTNVHQRLLEVFDARTAVRARTQAQDLLTGVQSAPMQLAAVGQFDPAGTGGPSSSPFGAAESLVNPWGFLLLVEGALLFAAAAAHRHAHAAGRAAIPFTVTSTPHGTASGAGQERSRGEVWTPVWTRPFTLAEVRHLFEEARATWRGRPAARAVDFYQAAVTHGVARGIAWFQRYGLHQRNGLAFVAVPLDRVVVRPLPAVRLAARLEDWISQARRADDSAAVRQALYRVGAAQVGFAQAGTPEALVELLAAVTGVELAVGRSSRAREHVPARRAPGAGPFLAELAKTETPELRIAVGLASCATIAAAGQPPLGMRELLLPVNPASPGRGPAWRDATRVPGYGIRPLPDVLTDVLLWRARTAADEPGNDYRGVPTFRAGVPVPADDLHAWAAGRVEGTTVARLTSAMLALSWAGVRHSWSGHRAPAVPVPLLGLLHPLARGMPAGTEPALALGPDWPALLAAGHVTRVHDAAVRRLRQAGWSAVASLPNPAISGRALAAALVPRCHKVMPILARLAVRIARPDDQLTTATLGKDDVS